MPGIGGTFTVKVCHGDNPGRVYIQNMDSNKNVSRLSQRYTMRYTESAGYVESIHKMTLFGHEICSVLTPIFS